MIQIDDSGSGSFIGGTCIGLYRPETNEYYFDIIPVELYNAENFKKKMYLQEVIRITEEGFKALKVNSDESIEICRGYMFEKLKEWLTHNNYNWYSTHIVGRIQEVVEKNFELYAENLGIPKSYLKLTKYPFHFHKLLRWVYADFENRIGFCKVGWDCWQKIQADKPDVFFRTMDISAYYCLLCGKQIKKGSSVKVIHFKSNRDNYIYLHKKCKTAPL